MIIAQDQEMFIGPVDKITYNGPAIKIARMLDNYTRENKSNILILEGFTRNGFAVVTIRRIIHNNSSNNNIIVIINN